MSDKQRTEHQETVNLTEDDIGAPNCPLPEPDLEKAKTTDTVHDDQAVKVIAAYSGDARWTEEEEKRLVKKIDRRLLPMLFLTYALQYYDKAMLSQAAIFGLRADLGLTTGNRYSMASSIFYTGYISGALPAVLLAQHFPIERVASSIVAVWGVCLMCTVVTHNYQGIYAQRFFLGFLEAGIAPMFMMIVSGFYKKDEQAVRLGSWWSASGFVGMVSPLVNYGLGHITGGPYQPWQYMYFFAGSVTILWAIAILFLLPPDPIRAKRFTDRERYIAVARMKTNNAGVRNTHFKLPQALEVLVDPRFWLAFLMAFCYMIANGPVSSFNPIIVQGFGFSQLNSLLLVMPAGFAAGCLSLGTTYLATKFPGWRCWLVIIFSIPTVIASILLWRLPMSSKGALLFSVYMLSCFAIPYGILMGLQTANTAGYTKKSVTASGLFLGYSLGNFAGPLFFKPEDAPRYSSGFVAVLVTQIAAILLAFAYRTSCVYENRRRDKAGTVEAFDHAYEDDLTDIKNPQFRYCL